MENQQMKETNDSRKKRLLFAILVIGVLLGISLAISLSLLGDRVGKVAEGNVGVISLFPPKPGQSGNGDETMYEDPEEKTVVVRRGDLKVYDEHRTWKSKTKVDLFQQSYDQTVVSDNGDKVVAPGTSYFYKFTLKNNGNAAVNYRITLKVESDSVDIDGNPEADPTIDPVDPNVAPNTGTTIPLEWRLLTADNAVVVDWQPYDETERILKQKKLKARKSDRYIIEWRWIFERGGEMDMVDTEMGNVTVTTPLEATATITVLAEQTEEASGPWWWLDTGDRFEPLLYVTALAVSGFGLVILLIGKRRKESSRA